MYYYKLFLYDNTQEANGYRGQDLSQYVLVGAQNTENVTDELDESNLTLHGYPYRDEFAPETKFILVLTEKNIENGEEAELEELHRVVEQDMVDQPIMSDDTYFIHNISLLEPSVIAQKRIVDNISVTYKLKDVNLQERKSITTEMVEKTNVENTVDDPPRGFGNYVDHTAFSDTRNTSFGKHFVWEAPDGESNIRVKYISAQSGSEVVKDFHYIDVDKIQPTDGKTYAQFVLPAPHIYWGIIDGTDGNPTHRPPRLLSPAYADIGCASFSWEITEKSSDGSGAKYSGVFMSNSRLGDVSQNGGIDTGFPFRWTADSVPSDVENYWLVESSTTNQNAAMPNVTYKFSNYTSADGQNLSSNYSITPFIEIKKNRYYSVSLKVVGLSSSLPNITVKDTVFPIYNIRYEVDDELNFSKFNYVKIKIGHNPYWKNAAINSLPVENVSPTANFRSYSASEGISVAFESGIPYSALALLKKAIINSDIYFKKSNLSPVDINNDLAEYPFYIDDGWAQVLALTQINENFYNQKNLWEIALEVGKYIHAIPELRFGKDDKFVFTFNPLGETERSVNAGTRSSITNFRGVGDYIASCSSYVENLVQLGGEITELVSPKSNSEAFIVSNETAQIIVSKPIIELLKIEVTCNSSAYTGINIPNGSTADITKFFYEKNVYQILSERYDSDPNKGIAMYYELGDKVIRGGDYRLPQANPNAYKDYAFKKILYCGWNDYPIYQKPIPALGSWSNIRVNDFTFKITYRTKDSARVEHTRPDLRHYLLSSKYDRYPTHRQFNNQQDILVDSDAFGSNMFGKLIRTGNSEYKVSEWCSSYSEVKHKGELYEIDGDLYYVAKVTHIIMPDHIESIVEYSKDYNQLSAVIGIPSEPRFYEISEQSSIDREVAINDFLLITTDLLKIGTGMISDFGHTADLIFGQGANFLKWAITTIRGDFDNGEPQTFGVCDFEKTTMLPISAYVSGKTLTYEWDMVDNFSAGDNVEREVEFNNSVNEAYRALRAVQYCDTYGKGTLLDFALRGEVSLSAPEIRSLPNYPTNRIVCEMDAKETAFSQDWLTIEGDPITPSTSEVYKVGYIYNADATVSTYLVTPSNTVLSNKIQEALNRAPAAGDTIIAYRYGVNLDTNKLAFMYIYTYDGANWNSVTIYDWHNGNYYGDNQFLYFTWDSVNSVYVLHDPTTDTDNIFTDLVIENPQSIVLLKDCRETLHFNYNLQAITDSDTFVIAPPFFVPKNEKKFTQSLAYETVEIPAGSNVTWEITAGQEILRLNPFDENAPIYATQDSGETLEKFNVFVYLDNEIYMYGDSSDEDGGTPFSLPSGITTQIPFVKKWSAVIADSQMFTVEATGTQTTVVTPFILAPKIELGVMPTYVALLRSEVNKLTNGNIAQTDIAAVFPLLVDKQATYFKLDLSEIRSINSTDWSNFAAKSVAIVQTVRENNTCRVIIAKNLPSGTTADQAGADWCFGAPDKSLFDKRQ